MNTDKQPYEVFLEVTANRGAEYPCPEYVVFRINLMKVL
ncbi:hypothetical protein DFAR_340051 [Desulfarculales bacterium]